ncbi:MAG: glycerate kinase, partial [Myxococcales bacterium]|nr:glycerate kinase [Myxococcales bacterium]
MKQGITGQRRLRVLIAPDAFKGCLSAVAVAHALRDGITQNLPSASCRLLPLADGGEGTLRALGYALFDAAGALLAADDDRPDEWNFRIARRLEPGVYTLKVDAVGGSGPTEVSMHAPEAIEVPALPLGEARALKPGASVVHVPLDLGPTPPALLIAEARSAENVGVAIEARQGDTWRALVTRAGAEVNAAARPDPKASAHRLRIWSLDQRGLPVNVVAHAPNLKVLTETAL